MIASLKSAAVAAMLTVGLAGPSVAATALADFLIDATNPTGTLSNDGGSLVVLTDGVKYDIEISGTVRYVRNADQFLADAEYGFNSVKAGPPKWDTVSSGGTTYDIGVSLDGVDIDWGPFNPANTYSTTFTGTGAAVRVAFVDADGAYGDNRDSTLRAVITERSGGGGADISPVPLPAGLPLLLAGLATFGLLRRRRR